MGISEQKFDGTAKMMAILFLLCYLGGLFVRHLLKVTIDYGYLDEICANVVFIPLTLFAFYLTSSVLAHVAKSTRQP